MDVVADPALLSGSPATGWSCSADAGEAATSAVSAAIGHRVPSPDDLVVLFCEVAFDGATLLEAARAAAAPARLVAASTDGAFVGSERTTRRCVALYLPAGTVHMGVGWGSAEGAGIGAAADHAVRAARDEVGGAEAAHGALMLLSQGGAGDQREVLHAAYHVTGASVPIVGGIVPGSDPRVWQRSGGELLRDGVVAVWFAASSPFGVGVDHGWRPVGAPLHVTRATRGHIAELDGKPAHEAYEHARAATPVREEDLRGPAANVLGIPTGDGGYEIRAFAGASPDGLELFGDVPDQAIVRLMAVDRSGMLAGTRRAVSAATAGLERPASAALVFSCACRLTLLGDDGADEVAVVSDTLGGLPACGFFTHGEFAKLPGSRGLHNASIAVLAL